MLLLWIQWWLVTAIAVPLGENQGFWAEHPFGARERASALAWVSWWSRSTRTVYLQPSQPVLGTVLPWGEGLGEAQEHFFK